MVLVSWINTVTFSATFSNRGSISYYVSAPNPSTHYFEVELELTDFNGDFADFKLPVWTPGSYLVREYAKNVEGFTAHSSDNKVLDFHKLNKNTWRVEKRGVDLVVIKYRVYANEGSVRMSYLDENHAFIMANTLLMYVEELRNNSTVLQLAFDEKWTAISTSLQKKEGTSSSYHAPNYDVLVDSPIEIGTHDVIEFTAAGVPHEIALYGAVAYDEEKLMGDLTKIIESATSVFGENPNEKYTFIIHADGRGGGLEHTSSTVLGVNRWTFTNERSYTYFLGLAAHEYFHLWLVKRLKPVELDYLNYDKEIYTDLLWVMEGFTSYFEERIMLECGFYSEMKFINNLIRQMEQVQNTPGAQEQSVAEASFDAWIKFYRKNENSQNNQISYYGKGLVLGAILDLLIIDGSKADKTLGDVMLELYHQFYKNMDKGIKSDDLKEAVEKASGENLSDFFDQYVYGTKDIDYKKFLLLAGIELDDTNDNTNTKSIGAVLSEEEGKLIIKSLRRGGSAYEHGLNVGDELLAINEYRVDKQNVGRIIDFFDAKDNVSVTLSRKGVIQQKVVEIRKDEAVRYSFKILKNPTKKQEKVYKTWMGK